MFFTNKKEIMESFLPLLFPLRLGSDAELSMIRTWFGPKFFRWAELIQMPILQQIQVERLMMSITEFVITVDWFHGEANCQMLLGGGW